MNNQEKREKRYQRRKAKRLAKKEKFLNSLPSFQEVFSFEHLYNSFWLCRKEVSWKPSIQIFQQNLTFEILKLMDELNSKQGFKSRGFIEFNICERGKMRHIKSVDIRERVVQRCFCDYYLLPLLSKNLIYDNGASLKNKGVSFTLNRLKIHLQKYYKKYNNNDGWIVLFDFSNYFGNINHEKLYSIVDPLFKDEKCKKLYHHLIDVFGEIGLGLGSQVSQISAIAFPNKIDQFFVNSFLVESYARYMDDGYIICHTKEDAKKCVEILLQLTKELDIKINLKKIKIYKLNHIFIFIKKRFQLLSTGKVLMKLNRNNIYKHRRKIKKLLKLIDKNKIKIENVEISHKSWLGQLKKFKNSRAVYNIHLQIRRLLDGYINSNNASNWCII